MCILEKQCSRCKEVLPVGMFHPNKKTLTGYCSYCKTCSNASSVEWKNRQPEEHKEKLRAYRQANKDRAEFLRKQKHFQARIRKIAENGFVIESKSSKVCSWCKIEKPLEAFNKNGKNSWCRDCCKVKTKTRTSLPEGISQAIADQIVSEYNNSFENSLIKKLSNKYNFTPYKIRTVLELAGVKLRVNRVLPETKGYYVYLHKTEENVVFYVGKGKGKRAWSKSRNNNDWTEFTKNNEYIVEIFKDNLDEQTALDIEQELFNLYKDTLLNKVQPVKQLENLIPLDIKDFIYYDPNSSTKIRAKVDIPMPNGGVRQKAGSEMGCFNKSTGRSVVRFKGVGYYVSRVVCVLHGVDPTGKLVDHINGDCSDDRIENLRLTTPVGNARNTVKPKKSNTGVVGVYEQKTKNTFLVAHRDNGCTKTKRFRFTEETRDVVFKEAVEYRMKIVRDSEEVYSDRHLGIEQRNINEQL
jgi:hypothetical protein